MNALVAGKAKLKLALCGHICGLRSTSVAQAHQSVRQQ